jgi:Pyrimidine dimer DNA glycosylase
MQTFLPYSDYRESAKVLDRARLGKQRVEVYQILRVLLGFSKGWANHPCVRQWKGYEWQLYLYGLKICQEWRNRGYKDTVLDKMMDMMGKYPALDYPNRIPAWLGNEKYHSSHRSNLLRKDPVWYSQFGWKEDSTLPYIWPVSLGTDNLTYVEQEAQRRGLIK